MISCITSRTFVNAEKVPHPNLISESGRALVAHHSVLIVEVFGAIEKIRGGEYFPIWRKRASAGEGIARYQEELAETQ